MSHENRPAISFEFFPPKTDAQSLALDEAVDKLELFDPDFVSVTYGAGGTTQERSFGSVQRLLARGLPVAAHLTCAAASRQTVVAAIKTFRDSGVERFVALRGDPPGGLSEPYEPHPDGYYDTAELIGALMSHGAMDISASGYPERHPQSPNWDWEIATLKRKVDAGALRAITQFFFDNDIFDAYRDRVSRAGIDIPIVPGIMPIHRFSSICGFAARCGTTIPAGLAERFEGLDPDSADHAAVAAEVATEQVADLLRRGVTAFHIYTLNRAELTDAICVGCGLVPKAKREAAWKQATARTWADASRPEGM